MKLIIVAGFMSSGSSAVVDLLREFDNTYVCETEFRCISDPYGIRQLESCLVEHWTPLRATAAISDFLEYMQKCSRKKTHFPFAPFGMGYAEYITPDFLKITEDYIASLVRGIYFEDHYYNKAKKSYLSYCIDRCRYGVSFYSKGRIPIDKKIKCYISHPTKSEFEINTRRYFSKLFKDISNKDFVILDQGIHVSDAEDVIDRYFDDAKMIVVDRDWRDMFVDRMEYMYCIGGDGENVRKSLKAQLTQEKKLRCGVRNTEKILYIKFEDLVEKYDAMVTRIINFVGLSKEHHVDLFKYFNPQESSKNVKLWERLYTKYKEAIDIITEYID